MVDIEAIEIEARLVAEYRKANPQSRVVSILRYAKNTSATKQMECILCGEEGPTWGSKWPQTKKAAEWETEHKKKHGIGIERPTAWERLMEDDPSEKD